MSKYIVFSAGDHHFVSAVTFTQGQNDLRFIGENGAVVAIFNHFEWLKVGPDVEEPVPTDTSSSDKPELVGE